MIRRHGSVAKALSRASTIRLESEPELDTLLVAPLMDPGRPLARPPGFSSSWFRDYKTSSSDFVSL
jgi:hypothetical protein